MKQEDARKIFDILTSESLYVDAERPAVAKVEYGSIDWLIAVFIIWSVLAYGSRKKISASLFRVGSHSASLRGRRMVLAFRTRAER